MNEFLLKKEKGMKQKKKKTNLKVLRGPCIMLTDSK